MKKIQKKLIKHKKDIVKKDKKSKKIYIVLSQTYTYPARMIHFYTSEPYSHASLAFDEELNEMYSFARRGLRNPFNAGFVEEDINHGIFGKCTSTICNVYQLKITQEQYNKLREEIEVFKMNKDDYSYNFLGVLGVALNVPIKTKQRYFCSQFVAYILEKSDIHIFNKNCSLVRPRDIRLNPRLKSIYKGKLADYRIFKTKNLCFSHQ